MPLPRLANINVPGAMEHFLKRLNGIRAMQLMMVRSPSFSAVSSRYLLHKRLTSMPGGFSAPATSLLHAPRQRASSAQSQA